MSWCGGRRRQPCTSGLPPRNVRVKAITDTRTALLAGLLGIGALATFLLNSRVHKLTEQGQITERYTKAIEQLGSTGLDVRLGGIYALERIAVDCARDHPTIAEVLSAFVREHSNPLYLYKQAGMPGWQGSPDEAELSLRRCIRRRTQTAFRRSASRSHRARSATGPRGGIESREVV